MCYVVLLNSWFSTKTHSIFAYFHFDTFWNVFLILIGACLRFLYFFYKKNFKLDTSSVVEEKILVILASLLSSFVKLLPLSWNIEAVFFITWPQTRPKILFVKKSERKHAWIVIAKKYVGIFTWNGFYRKWSCTTMCNYKGTCNGICRYNLVYIYHYKVQFLPCTFQMHFGMGMRH